ncbi:tyrosine-type recombinase/integrase [Paenibacillus sp. JSM ZJ436]|uniref:tyrosine-type recombinase/integrase n=1 Tax=Paenibacillus sp. JSM ZJ436 TaxID=3376190 RepID=UPI00379E6862
MEQHKFNVVGLHSGSVYEDIRTFIDKFHSMNTRSNYERHIRNFFVWFRGKQLEQLQQEDMPIRNADVIKFQLFLRNHEADYSNSTINVIMAAVQSLYEFLEINEYNVNSKFAKVDVLPDDSESAGALYYHEAEAMANTVMTHRKGHEKSAFLRMAYTTSLRKSTLLNIKWSDINKNPNENHYLVSVIGKGGKKHIVPIPDQLYNELLLIKEQEYYQQYKDNKVFHLSKTTIQNMMDTLKEQLGLSAERNITFHSFRNVAASYGSLEEVQDHLNHSNINTTNKYYRHKTKDYSQSLSLRMGKEIDNSIFNELSKEELISLIMNQGAGAILNMQKEAQEIMNIKGVV